MAKFGQGMTNMKTQNTWVWKGLSLFEDEAKIKKVMSTNWIHDLPYITIALSSSKKKVSLHIILPWSITKLVIIWKNNTSGLSFRKVWEVVEYNKYNRLRTSKFSSTGLGSICFSLWWFYTRKRTPNNHFLRILNVHYHSS